MRHPLFWARTVLVQNADVEASMQALNRILGRESIFKEHRYTQRFEKPWKRKRRLSIEKCSGIYLEDANRRINFLMRKNRENPYPGCY